MKKEDVKLNMIEEIQKQRFVSVSNTFRNDLLLEKFPFRMFSTDKVCLIGYNKKEDNLYQFISLAPDYLYKESEDLLNEILYYLEKIKD